jgi:hypothetical protein
LGGIRPSVETGVNGEVAPKAASRSTVDRIQTETSARAG